MRADSFPTCPHCHSEDVIPFEEDNEPDGNDISIFWIIVIATALVLGYFFLTVLTYIYYPLLIFALIIVATRLVRREEQRRKRKKYTVRDYICTECGSSFRR